MQTRAGGLSAQVYQPHLTPEQMADAQEITKNPERLQQQLLSMAPVAGQLDSANTAINGHKFVSGETASWKERIFEGGMTFLGMGPLLGGIGATGKSAAKHLGNAADAVDNVAVKGIKAAGSFNHTVKSLDDALATIRKAMPDAVELPPAVAGQPYPSPPAGVKKWFQIHPPEPGVGNNLPHIKFADWTNGKKGTGGSWGHIFFP